MDILKDLETVTGDIYERWDADQRSGKLLTALAGHMPPGYDARCDNIRKACNNYPALVEVLGKVSALAQSLSAESSSKKTMIFKGDYSHWGSMTDKQILDLADTVLGEMVL